LGEAEQLLIYGGSAGGHELVERRDAPRPGGGATRWQAMANRLHDCRAVLAASAGQSPRAVLRQSGIKVIMMEGLIDEGLQAVFGGQPVRAPLRREHRCGSGAGCTGNGLGCM
jgi:nitrogen fixation protein NifB